jgi:Protein of unknown function (DUF2934)
MERSLAEREGGCRILRPGAVVASILFEFRSPAVWKLLAAATVICCNTPPGHSPTNHVFQGGLVMTRTVTPPAAQPAAPPKVTRERIAMRAYEKWLQRGGQHGNDQQDWLEAEAELAAEMKRGPTTAAHSSSMARPVTPAPQPAPAAARRR